MLAVVIGIGILALLALLRAVWCWGVAEGERREFCRQRPKRYDFEE